MRNFPVQLASLIQVTFLYWCYGQEMDEDQVIHRTDCKSNNDICYALLRISGGTVIAQEPTQPNFSDYFYCGCPNGIVCNTSSWETEPGRHLTFYHYERVDWQIQFKLCSPVQLSYCDNGDDVAAVLRTAANERWRPYLAAYNCRCRDDTYFIMGWRLKKIAGADHWEYNFICDRPQCEEKAPCHRHYVKRSELHTVAYDFYCSCQSGWECPLGVSPIKSYAQEGEDKEIGPYVHGYCSKIPGWGSFTKAEE